MNTYTQIYKYTFASYTRNINTCVKRFLNKLDISYVFRKFIYVRVTLLLVLVLFGAVILFYTVLDIGVESPDHINSV